MQSQFRANATLLLCVIHLSSQSFLSDLYVSLWQTRARSSIFLQSYTHTEDMTLAGTDYVVGKVFIVFNALTVRVLLQLQGWITASGLECLFIIWVNTMSHGSVCVCVFSSAYKEKVKELPLVSLFCACLNPRTIENPTYKAEGKNKALRHLNWERISREEGGRLGGTPSIMDLHGLNPIPQMQWTWAGASSKMWRWLSWTSGHRARPLRSSSSPRPLTECQSSTPPCHSAATHL